MVKSFIYSIFESIFYYPLAYNYGNDRNYKGNINYENERYLKNAYDILDDYKRYLNDSVYNEILLTN